MRRSRVLMAQERPSWASTNPDVTVEEVSKINAVREALAVGKPAVAIIPLDMRGLGGTAGLGELRELSPQTKFIAVAQTNSEHEEVEVLRSGAKGYVSRALPDALLTKAVEKVQEGEIWAGRHAIGSLLEETFGQTSGTGDESLVRSKRLEGLTVREREIVQLLAGGASNKEIAASLQLSVSTVKAHLTSIFRKLDQPDRLRLVLSLTEPPRDHN